MRVFLGLLAEVQVAEEALLREERSVGAGRRFLDDIEAMLELLESNPRMGRLRTVHDSGVDSRAIRVGTGGYSLLVYDLSAEELVVKVLVDTRRSR